MAGLKCRKKLIPVVADYGAIQFSLGSYITCPQHSFAFDAQNYMAVATVSYLIRH